MVFEIFARLEFYPAQLVVCHETSVTNYQSTLCNIPEEHGSNLHREVSLHCRMVCVSYVADRAVPLCGNCCSILEGWEMFKTFIYD